MIARISPSTLSGELTIPPSKSWMQRVCAAALLHNGQTIIKNYGQSADDLAALEIIQNLGAEITKTVDAIIIKSNGIINPNASTIYCGESGLSTRLFLPIAALASKAITITGSGSLLHRPMGSVLDALPQIGVQVKSNNGHLPVTTTGPLKPKDIEVDGSLSSQFLSGLLFALSAAATKPVTIHVHNLVSKPYVDMTLDVLRMFGHNISHQNYQRFLIETRNSDVSKDIEINIPSDWSSGAYWLIGAAINGCYLILRGLKKGSFQADEMVLEILKLAGANFSTDAASIVVNKSHLKAFNTDLTHAPDLFPIVAVLAACSYGTSTLNGLHRLTHKESNRAESIQAMLSVLGVRHQTTDNQLIIEGKEYFDSETIDGYNDHRIVMAAAIASLRMNDELTLTNAEAVAKSYPSFFKDAATLGMNCVLSS